MSITQSVFQVVMGTAVGRELPQLALVTRPDMKHVSRGPARLNRLSTCSALLWLATQVLEIPV